MDVDKQMLGGFEAMLPIVNQISGKLELNSQETDQLKDLYKDWLENDIDRVKMRIEIAKLYSNQFTVTKMNQNNRVLRHANWAKADKNRQS
ncbi:hypothetical protein O9929_21025 [Vibrio lentus]|nr:hypothetical protein [Vibrio lentus]